ncbi:hypothetical protein ColTof4_11113 [Colletotrichum tofieldiae]|uniref:Uncharacterized protein n=1 Tax=Colletotrichum tofieldiae TaxID=708197 RepID=A0A166YCZ0_9PEZI|nr:hypothetical protein CT0861_09340 [Colletotrichum tofieldiae]GKT56958.1 hypothetical protein ColTof3_04297 [Colletotrichum tofieldiae]GKT78690.1 hypothetical protein ColTof4_11113 [Colletotrichum tofieldiae]GKT87105.1 hypothetical protein Ct61P_04955 [Colletotrichum tofieldiae]
MSSEQKPLSWWKRHCTPPPALNRTPQCPCSACWNGNGEHWKTTAPETTAPTFAPAQNALKKETRTSALRRETESDLEPLRREETSSTTNLSVYSQESRVSSDRVSLTSIHRLARGKEMV